MTTPQKMSGTMNVLLWIAQLLLAAGFIWAACTKLLKPTAELNAMWPWTADNPGLVKVTAIFDLLAGLGLVLPMLLKIQPRLTVYAAYGSILLMIAASIFHISRGEASLIGINIFFALLAAFVAWGRSRRL